MARKRAQRSGDVVVWVVVGAVTLLACVGVVVLLTSGDTTTPESASGPIDAEALYSQHCGTCHGIEGDGAIGPQLSGGAVAAAYPDIDDQVVVIADGLSAMPPFANTLSEAEIRAVAEYTRSL